MMSTTSISNRMEFVNRGFNAAIHIRRCTLLKTRPGDLRRTNFLGQPLMLEVCLKKLIPIACGRSKRLGGARQLV
jgi:hypothetical protein